MDKVLKHSHRVLEEVLTLNDISVDMTCGGGNDTLFLAKNSKKVYAFDIQEEAIRLTKEKTKDYNNIIYILDNHINLKKYVNEEVKAVIFNLGYLPNGDKNLTTVAQTTISAIKEALSILAKGGVCAICLYPGHKEGKKESEEVIEMVKNLNQHEFEVLRYEFINQINEPPFLIAIEKKI